MGTRSGLKILILVGLVNQNIIAGSAECTPSNSIPNNATSFNSNPSQMVNDTPETTSTTSSATSSVQQHKRAAQIFTPSQQINFIVSPQNSKNNAASSKLTLQNSNPTDLTTKASPTSASNPSLVSSPVSQPIFANVRLISSQNQPAPESGQLSNVNNFSGNYIALSQNEKVANSGPYANVVNSMPSPTENGINNVISTVPQSLNRAEGSFKLPVQFTSSSLGQNTAKTGKPSTVNIVNTNFNVANSKNLGIFNTGANSNRAVAANSVNSISFPTQNGLNAVSSSEPESLNRACSSFWSPVKLTLSSLSPNTANTGNSANLNMKNNNLNEVNLQNTDFSNTQSASFSSNRPTGYASANAINSESLQSQNGLNTVISPASQPLNCGQSGLKLTQNSQTPIKNIDDFFNISRLQNSGISNTNGPTKIVPNNFGNVLFSPTQNSLNTIISPVPQSSNGPVQFTQLSSSGQNSAKLSKPLTLNITNSNTNTIGTQNPTVSNCKQTKVASENPVSSSCSPAQNSLNSVNSPSLQAVNYVQARDKTPEKFIAPSLNTLTDNNFTSFNNALTQDLAYLITNTSAQKAGAFTSTGSLNFIPSSTSTSSNYVDSTASQASIKNLNINSYPSLSQGQYDTSAPKFNPSSYAFTNTNSNIFIPNTLSLNQVTYPLPNINFIPSAKPCTLSSSSMLQFSPASSLQNNYPQNNINLPSVSSGNSIPRSTEKPLPPTINNYLFSPKNTVPKVGLSEKATSQTTDPSRVLMEKFKANMAFKSNIETNIGPNLSNILNEGINLSQSQPINTPGSDNSNIPSVLLKKFNLNQLPSCNLAGNPQSKFPETVNFIIPSTSSPVSSTYISASGPATNSQYLYCSQSDSPGPSNLLQPDFGTTSGDALSSNLLSFSSRPSCTLSNVQNDLYNLEKSQPENFQFIENSNKPSIFPNNFNPQQLSSFSSQSKISPILNVFSPPCSVPSSPSASSVNSQICNCQPNQLSSLQQLGLTSPLPSSNNKLSSSSSLSSCLCQNIPNEGTYLGLLQAPCGESNCNQANIPVSNNLQPSSLQQLGMTSTLLSSNKISSSSSSSSCLCQDFSSEGTNLGLSQAPCLENNCNQLNIPVSNNLQLSSLQQLGMTSTLPSSNKLSSSLPLSSCLCQNIPSEVTNSGLPKPLNTQCAENNYIPLSSCNTFNTQQTSPRNLKSQVPHTLNIIRSNSPNRASSISSPAPSQTSDSVCSPQPNIPVTSNVLPLNFVQNFGGTTSLSPGNAMPSNMENSKLNLATNAASVLVSDNGFNVYNQPSSYSAVPVTYQQVSTSILNEVFPVLSERNTFDSGSNPTFAYSGSTPVSNPFTSNVAAPFTESIPNALLTVNSSPLETTETLSSPPCIVPINYVTSHISSPVLDSYNAWVPSLVESFLTAFEPQTLLQALSQGSQYEIPPFVSETFSSSNEIDPRIFESLLQDSQSGYVSLNNPSSSCNDYDTQIIQYLLQDPQCDLSSLLYDQNLPSIIDNEPIVLDSLPTQQQFAEFSSDYSILPNYEQLDSSDYHCADSPIVLKHSALTTTCSSSSDCNSASFPTYFGPLPPQIIIDDNGSMDSSSAEQFIKWTILTELCNRCKLDPLLALALGSFE